MLSGAQIGGMAECDVELDSPRVDARGVLEQEADVASAEPGSDLDDVALPVGSDDDLGVRGAVADAKRLIHNYHPPPHRRSSEGLRDDRQLGCE